MEISTKQESTPGFNIFHNISLSQYPQINQNSTRAITIGDLHGNTLKLLYLLIKEDLIELDSKRYDDFVADYKKAFILSNNILLGITDNDAFKKRLLCIN
jgi:hypothetical protein